MNLFSGLSLGPAAYYLLLTGPAASPFFYWWTAVPATVTVDPASTLLSDRVGVAGASYPPANFFSVIDVALRPDRNQFTVTGTPGAAIPEPSTLALLAIGTTLVLVGQARRSKPH